MVLSVTTEARMARWNFVICLKRLHNEPIKLKHSSYDNYVIMIIRWMFQSDTIAQNVVLKPRIVGDVKA